MPTNYLDLCNRTLRRLNEVEIPQSEFSNTRGIQTRVKDAVKAAVAKVNQAEFEWPFNASEHTMTLEVGQTQYSWPDSFKTVDWNSFQLKKNVALGVGFQRLRYLERDQYYLRHRDRDDEAGAEGLDRPTMVFPTHGSGFGVTPVPDKPYEIRFRYFLNYANISKWNDLTRIPESFDTVIVDGAMYYMYMFKDNPESAQLAWRSFEEGLKDLQTLYINNYEEVFDRRVNFGGRSGGGTAFGRIG